MKERQHCAWVKVAKLLTNLCVNESRSYLRNLLLKVSGTHTVIVLYSLIVIVSLFNGTNVASHMRKTAFHLCTIWLCSQRRWLEA